MSDNDSRDELIAELGTWIARSYTPDQIDKMSASDEARKKAAGTVFRENCGNPDFRSLIDDLVELGEPGETVYSVIACNAVAVAIKQAGKTEFVGVGK